MHPSSRIDAATRASLIEQATKSRGIALVDLAEKFSDARLERIELEDGRSFVLKHLPRAGDWLTRATGGAGRVVALWSSGTLDAVSGAVDHTILDCIETPDGWAIVMRDAGAELIPVRVPVARATSNQLLRGLARLHALQLDVRAGGLCSISSRYRLFAPQFHRDDAGPGRHPMRDVIVEGWDVFFDLAPADVGEAVAGVHADAAPLVSAFEAFPAVLLHGDAKLENMGLDSERLVLVDWGDLTGLGPVEIDIAWYVLRGAARITTDIDGLFADYAEQSGRRLDPGALDLACLGSLAQMGFRMANSRVRGRPESQEIGAYHLDWWTRRVQRALDNLPY